MTIAVRKDSTWKYTDRVYVPNKDGKWTRVYGAWVWSTMNGVTAWRPVFDYAGKLAVPPTPTPFLANHSGAYMTWTKTDDPTITGYRLILRVGPDVNTHITQVYPDWSLPPFPVDREYFGWEGLQPDQYYTWTMIAHDEFGKTGPESPPLTLFTGHPKVVHSSPGYPGYTIVDFAPDRTGTYVNTNSWYPANYTTSQNVKQGTPKNSINPHWGCVTYNHAYRDMCNNYFGGEQVPRSALEVISAKIKSISRVQTEAKGTNRVECRVALGNVNWYQEPVRFPNLDGIYAETFFTSPTPGNSELDVRFDRDGSTLAYARVWLGADPDHHQNGLILRNDNGKQNADGLGAVTLYPHRATPDPNTNWSDWAVRVAVRWTYDYVTYLSPRWVV